MVQNSIIQGYQIGLPDITTYPIRKTTLSDSSNTVISVSGYGDVIGTSGFRLWNGSATQNTIVTPSNPWIAPVSFDFISFTPFDAILLLNIDGKDSVYGYSFQVIDNVYFSYGDYDPFPSELNQLTDISIVNENLYWSNLLRCKGGSNPPSAQEQLPYFFGGDSLIYGSSGVTGALKLNLLKPVTSNTTFTYQMSVYDYDLLDNISQTTGTKILTPLSAYRNVPFGDFPSGIPNNLRGFVVISISCSNPNYRSLLKYFHWGLTPLQYG